MATAGTADDSDPTRTDRSARRGLRRLDTGPRGTAQCGIARADRGPNNQVPLVNVAGLVAILLSVIPVYIATRITADTGVAGRT